MTPVGDPETGPGAHAAPGPGGATPFQRIAKAYGPAVLRVCRAMVGPVDADDAWSETFLAALRGYPSLAADADVEAWLVTIAQHKSVDLIRRRVRGPVPVEDLPTRAGDIGVPGAGDRFVPLWRALARLPLVQRQAVVCHYLAGMPYAAAADVIGNSAAAARRAGADGIAALRRDPTLRDPPPDPPHPRADAGTASPVESHTPSG